MSITLTPKQRAQPVPEPRPAQSLTPRRLPTVRYSRFVGLMRVLLPGLAVALLGVMLAWPKLSGRDDLDLGLTGRNGRALERPTMVNPRYVGTDSSDRPYVVTADQARAADAQADVIDLAAPKASIALRGGSEVSLGAESGTFRQKEQVVDLSGKVVLNDARGYTVKTDKARIDLATSGASGDAPVQGQGPFGTLEAQGFTVTDEGRTVQFTGKSHATLQSASRSRP